MRDSLTSLRNVQILVLKRLVPASKEKEQDNSYHRDRETMPQESVVLLVVDMVGTSMKVLGKVA